MTTTHRWRLAITSLAAALALAACGGGGDSTAPAVESTPVPPLTPPPLTPPPGSPPPQGQAAPAQTGNIAVDGRNWINYRRTQLGVPVMAQNAAIDRAALNHSEYQKLNGGIPTHNEETGKPGFTGVRLLDRLGAAGYSVGGTYAIGEVISATTNNSGFYMAEELITAIYHRFVMFEPKFREIGTGSAVTADNYYFFTANFASANGFGPGLGAGKIAIWPYNGQTAVPPIFYSDYESPDPVANQNEVGYPVSVHADINVVLTVQTFTIRQRGGALVPSKMLTKALDAEHTAASVAAIVPLTVLKAGTVYDVTFAGTADGAPISQSWSFTTR